MSNQLINQYYSKLDRILKFGGSKNETAIRSAFQNLLEQYCANKNLILVPELKYGTGAIPDGRTSRKAYAGISSRDGSARASSTKITCFLRHGTWN